MAKEKKPKAEKAKKPKKEKKEKVIICPSCGMETPKKAKHCIRCGKELPKKKGGAMVILAPVIVLLLAALISIVVFAFPIGLPIDLPFGLPIKLGTRYADSVLAETMELTGKQEKAVLAVLESCGFTEIVDVSELPSAGKNQAYAVQDKALARYTDDESAVVKINEDTKEVVSASFRGKELYSGGEAVSQLGDHYLGAEGRDALMVEAIDAVKGRLDLPDTAVFPSRTKWSYTEDGEQVIVSATVNAKNTGNVATDYPFTVVFEGKEIVSVTVGGADDGE